MAGTSGFTLFPKKQETLDNIEEQIKVLATNIEVLNQKLITDPNASISPGEAIIKKQLIETIAKIEYVENFLQTTQNTLASQLLDNAKGLQKSFLTIQKSIETIPQERNELREEIVRLKALINNLNKLDKEWLQGLFSRLEILNNNMQVMNKNMGQFYSNLTDEIKRQVNSISEEATNKIYKSMVWFIIGIVTVSILASIFATIIAKSFIH
jgi:hypothetical protein